MVSRFLNLLRPLCTQNRFGVSRFLHRRGRRRRTRRVLFHRMEFYRASLRRKFISGRLKLSRNDELCTPSVLHAGPVFSFKLRYVNLHSEFDHSLAFASATPLLLLFGRFAPYVLELGNCNIFFKGNRIWASAQVLGREARFPQICT